MERKEEACEISRLVYELTVASGFSSDLDELLKRLFGILHKYHEFPIEPCGAILLLNPRGKFFQVAQFGIDPPWKSSFQWNTGTFADPTIAPDCKVEDALIPHADEDGNETRMARIILMPLHVENQGIGYALLCAKSDYQPGSTHMVFFNDLAHSLSGLVNRILTLEILAVRELELEEARSNAIRTLGVASEYRDNETGWHIMRMANFALAIAKAMDLPEQQREILYITAPMHDVGKIGIADSILLKKGKLTAEEFEIMKTHTTIGVSILGGKDPVVSAARDVAGSHHEKWDGTGYPQGLKGGEIPLLARICAIADVFDALTSTRPYKEPWPVEKAIEWIISQSGKHFDPAVVKAFEQSMPDLLRIRELYRDDIIDPKEMTKLPPVERGKEEWVSWNDSLLVGIATIDEHHRYLFDLLNDLYDVVVNKRGLRNVARLIKALETYAKVHFRAEEKMMSHYGYKGLKHQETQHHAYEEKIREFYEELHLNPLVAQFDALLYLRNWLINHILIEDVKLHSLVHA